MNSEQQPDQHSPRPRHENENDPRAGQSPRARRAMLGLTITLLMSWVLMMSPLPFSLFAGITGLVAGVLMVMVIVFAFQEKRYATGVVTTVVGIPAVLLIALGAVTSTIFYGPMSKVQECQRTAITETARSQCESLAQESTTNWINDLFGG